MSLTTGKGPLSGQPAGRFDEPIPAGVVYVEPFGRRVRALVGDRTVVDSERVLLVHRPGEPPTFAFPMSDVATAAVRTEPEAHAPDHVRVPWDAPESWLEEDEEATGRPRNPYHRVDCLPTSRRLRVVLGGVVLVDTTDTLGVYETSLAPRLYVARTAALAEALVPSTTTTYCACKGTASYWHVVIDGVVHHDVAWSYEDPFPESLRLAGLLGFDEHRADVEADLPAWP